MLPKDEYMLLSAVNMLLRDKYESLKKLAEYEDEDEENIKKALAKIGYAYDEELNKFV